jgi:hypothetical protein
MRQAQKLTRHGKATTKHFYWTCYLTDIQHFYWTRYLTNIHLVPFYYEYLLT